MKSIFTKAILLTLTLYISLLSTSLLAEIQWLDKIIVVVEDDVILDSEFKRKLKTVKQQFLANNSQLPSEDALKKQVLERMIIDQIQIQMGVSMTLKLNLKFC